MLREHNFPNTLRYVFVTFDIYQDRISALWPRSLKNISLRTQSVKSSKTLTAPKKYVTHVLIPGYAVQDAHEFPTEGGGEGKGG